MTRIEKLRKVVDEHRATMIDGYLVDVQTANMLVTVHEHLTSDKHRAAFETADLMRVVNVGWKAVGATAGRGK